METNLFEKFIPKSGHKAEFFGKLVEFICTTTNKEVETIKADIEKFFADGSFLPSYELDYSVFTEGYIKYNAPTMTRKSFLYNNMVKAVELAAASDMAAIREHFKDFAAHLPKVAENTTAESNEPSNETSDGDDAPSEEKPKRDAHGRFVKKGWLLSPLDYKIGHSERDDLFFCILFGKNLVIWIFIVIFAARETSMTR